MNGTNIKGKYSMIKPAQRPATCEDLCALPDKLVGEILAGELVATPRPAPRHALAATKLGGMVSNTFGRRSDDGRTGDWWILGGPECHLGPDVIVPDIAG